MGEAGRAVLPKEAKATRCCAHLDYLMPLCAQCHRVTYASLWHGTKFYSRYDGLIFCDIFSRVQAFASIGVMCGVTAVLRNLYELIRLQGPSLSRIPGKHAWKGYLVDLSICAAFPIIQSPLLYLVQVRRYIIVENIGCSLLLSDSWLSLLLYYIWFAIWALIAAVYAILTIRLFFSRDDDLDNVFVTIEIGITKSYFIKILIFALLSFWANYLYRFIWLCCDARALRSSLTRLQKPMKTSTL